MSIGKIRYLNSLNEDNFSELINNSDGTTVIMEAEATYTDKFSCPQARTTLTDQYLSDFGDQQPDVVWVTNGMTFPTEKQIWYGHKMPCPDMLCTSPFPWAKRVFSTSYPEFSLICNSEIDHPIASQNWPPDIHAYKPTKLYSCFINKISGKYLRLATILSLCENDMLDKGIVRFCSHPDVWQEFQDTRQAINQYDTSRFGMPNYYQSIQDYINPHLQNIRSDSYYDTFTGKFDMGYTDGLIDIVTLSSSLFNSICEKTIRAILLGKPFVLIGAPGCHKTLLTNNGYEVYDELFDISLDNHIEDQPNKVKSGNRYNYLKHIRSRANYYTKMLDKIYNMDDSQSHIDHLYKITREKARHNQENFFKRLFDDDLIPDILRHPEFEKQMPDYYFHVLVRPRYIFSTHPYFGKFVPDKLKQASQKEYRRFRN